MRGDIIPPRRPETPRPRRPETQGFGDITPAQTPPVALEYPQNPQVIEAPVSNVLPSSQKEPSLPVPIADPKPDNAKPPEKKKISLKKKIAAGVVSFIVVLLLIIAGIWVWYNQQLSAVAPGSNEKVKITIQPGTDPAGIAALLKKNDIIKSETAFTWYVRLQGKSGLLQSGAYRLSKSDDVPAVVKHLTSGNTDTFSITFLPGATLQKHREALISAGYDAGAVDSALAKTYDHPLFASKPATADIEGYIYGETYSFGADATPEQILTRTFDEFQSVVEENDLIDLYKAQGFTLYQAITMASIIQREVATPTDAAQVAQVFKLRFDKGMQLGSDVTYQYIADKTGQQRSVDLDSPYNTRRYAGLPPGPISSPGFDALKAVANPAPGDYVYFLSGDDDKTYFARTNEEHEKNIRDHCQKKCQII